MAKYKFQQGCMWEGGEWQIKTNVECTKDSIVQPCKHCHSEKTKSTQWGGTECVFICPSVVIAVNEGGHNSTGVCLDCILEAAKEIGRQNNS